MNVSCEALGWDPETQTQLQVVEQLNLLHFLINELRSLKNRIYSCVLELFGS